MMNGAVLFSPMKLGEIEMKNRILMAPMTRARVPGRIPDKSTEIYYAQRAGAGLIITEATTVSQQGDGTLATPCLLYTSDAADERSSVDLGGRRLIKTKTKKKKKTPRPYKDAHTITHWPRG
mgnify:CR=1 FL=1